MTTIVLSGSLGSTAEMWEPQRPVLADVRVVALEHPGHGPAPVVKVATVADLAARALAQIDDERFSFVGLSLGGAVGMQIALDAPERVEKLVLAATSMRFGDPQQWRERAATVRAQGLEAIVDATMGRWFTQPADDRWRSMFLSVDREGYARCCEALAAWDVREAVSRIDVPTLAIAGREDPTTPPEHLHALADAIPGARLEVVEGAAHLVNVDRADAFNELLEVWL
ncbi:MAG: alpha/beta fold hydrolase [Gaiellaceae bacterium]